eukprot:CAMPEP_0118934224 /NCGR_PEP_ID=MMETSP1169-20130426/13706_1 /TAXON_ID=36882 /ORGANISM="Pyramimonas obovata, Strain CCMP722" /LENGTH=224 /DNA_ID=CAMNT_0006877101 /DNA_START=215 /DNA_END=886 /DNA_ORIENTATION=+
MFAALKSRAHTLRRCLSSSQGVSSVWVREMSQSNKQDVVIQLKKPFPGLGMPGDFVEVRPGYARNYLIPQRVARLLDSQERKAWRAQQEGTQEETPSRSLERDFQLTLQQLPKVIQRLTVQTLVLKQMVAKDSPQVLAKPLTPEQLAAAVEKQMKVVLAPESMLMGDPIRTLGEHVVPLYFDPLYVKGRGKVKMALKVHVVHADTPKEDMPSTTPVRAKKGEGE